jgi:integrase
LLRFGADERRRKHETRQQGHGPPHWCRGRANTVTIKLRRQRQDTDRDNAGDTWIDTGLVFTTRHGTPIEPRNFSRSFDRRIARAKVLEITVHGARKTCGSLLATLDVHPRVAMQILRHSKIALTMEIYTEIPSAATRDALVKLGQWLGE